MDEDFSSLARNIRSVAAKATETPPNEPDRLALLTAARELIGSLERPDETVNSLAIELPGRLMCVRVAIDLGIFDHLSVRGTQTVEQLAKACNAEPLLTLRLVRSLAAMRFVCELDVDTYGPTDLTRTMTKDHVKAGVIHWYDQDLPSIASAPAYFRENGYRSPETSTTGPFQYANKTSLETYTFWKTQPGVVENFNTFMNGHFAGKQLSWLEWFPAEQVIVSAFDEAQSPYMFVDVGGGRGHEANALRKMFPDAKGKIAVEDLPDVIDDQRELDKSIERVKHNFFQPQPVIGSRSYFLSNILHNWPDGEALKIVQMVATAMTPSYSRLLIADQILPNTGPNARALGMDIGMLTLHAGMQRSENQWHELFGKAGLKVIKFWLAPGDGDGVVEVAKMP